MNKLVKIFLIVLVLFSLPIASHAQSTDSNSLTITPPFFELNVDPGDSWSSSIRVVNTNPGDIQVHAIVMGFGAGDNEGHGSFIPLSQVGSDTDALANWVTISGAPVDVPSANAVDIPFSVVVPADASPGGHYAAILIGTGSPTPQPGQSQVGVSSFISALIFVQVSGNITESAQIQNFTSDKGSYQTPDVHFQVSVQNTGNTHVRPVGTIQIYNAFGKERGSIPINQTGDLGYVLPSSSREFDVEWQGQPSLFDIGPYTAVLSLGYGENGTKSITETIGFWVLPIDKLLEVGFGVLLAAMILMYIIKRIVRKMLANEISRYGGSGTVSKATPVHHRAEHKVEHKKIAGDTLDLRGRKDE